MGKFRKCKNCGSEISSRGKAVCPSCGLVHKKPFYKKVWFIILVLIILVGALASSSDSPKVISETVTSQEPINSTESIKLNESNSTEPPETINNPERTEFFLGEFVNLKDIVVRVIEVSDFTEENQFLQPDEGFLRKAIEVEITNIGTDDYDLQSIFAFEIRDSSGYSYTTNWIHMGNEVLTGAIPVGGKARGYVFFDIPKEETISQLLYDYALYSNGQITFNLDVSKAVTNAKFTNSIAITKVDLGEEIVDSKLTVTVNSVKQAPLSKLDMMSNDGYMYLIADISIKNTSSGTEYIYTNSMFYAVDTEGFRYKSSIYADGLRGDLDGDLMADKESRAEIAFIIKKGVTIDYIVYSDTLSISTLPVVNINELIN